MPTYQYRCPKCGDYDVTQRITESAFSSCTTCGSPVERLISAASFVLKGGGWYSSGYGSKNTASAEKEGEAKSAKSDTKTETKTESSGHSCGGGCDHGPN
jgi:putative FmdB family regulatory protein